MQQLPGTHFHKFDESLHASDETLVDVCIHTTRKHIIHILYSVISSLYFHFPSFPDC